MNREYHLNRTSRNLQSSSSEYLILPTQMNHAIDDSLWEVQFRDKSMTSIRIGCANFKEVPQFFSFEAQLDYRIIYIISTTNALQPKTKTANDSNSRYHWYFMFENRFFCEPHTHTLKNPNSHFLFRSILQD